MSSPNRTVFIGIAAIVAILLIAAVVLFFTLPDAGAFNARVEQLFVENDNLSTEAEIILLDFRPIPAQPSQARSQATAW